MDRTTIEVERGLQAFYGSGEMGHGSPKVSGATLLGSGYEADVYAFSMDGKDHGTGEEFVLRVYAGEGAAEKAAREFAVMGRLHEAGYPVPQVIAAASGRSPFGQPFVIMERIHGVSMGSSYWSAPNEQRTELQSLLCRLMIQLHALEGSGILPGSPLAQSRDPYAFIDDQLFTLSQMLNRLGSGEPPSLRTALAWLSARRLEVPCERLVVLHGDFHPNNVLLRADGAAFVIDWSNVRLGDYRSDLAWTRLITSADGQPDGGAAELHQYERLAGSKFSMIEYFEIAACIRLLASTLLSLQHGAARQGMRPGAEALMRRHPGFTRSIAALLQKRMERKMPDLEDALTAALG